MEIKCDVCGINLIQSGNVGIYTCKEVPIWIEDRQRYLEIRHTTCHVVNNKVIYKEIDVFPYKFCLSLETNKTSIFKSIIRTTTLNDGKNIVYNTDKRIVLEIDHIIDLPWNDKEQVIQKLKLYSAFS
jgi:hypothetical protein